MAININNIVDSLQSQINDVTDNTSPVEIIKLLKASKNVQEEFISIANINGIEGLADALALKLNVSDFETQFNQQFTAANILTLLKTVDGISSGLDADTLDGNTSDFFASATDLSSHESNISNPHSVTKTQVGLSNVDNTSDINKPVSTATQTSLDLKADQSTTYTKTEVDAMIEDIISQLETLTGA